MTDITTLNHSAATYATQALGLGTRRAYKSAWSTWSRWCDTTSTSPLAATEDHLARYLAHRADTGASVSTIVVAMAAMREGYRLAGVPWPAGERVKMVMAGIRRSKGVAPSRQALAATPEKLRAMIAATPSVRDRAILMIGFGAAARRSEIAALDLADIAFVPQGLTITIRRSKSDQTGEGALIPISHGPTGFCPVLSLRAWLASRGDLPGALFGPMIGGVPHRLSDRGIARIIQSAAKAAGLGKGYSGHSLRSGLITAASQSGASLTDIMRAARHQRPETTLKYIRNDSVWTSDVTQRIFNPEIK